MQTDIFSANIKLGSEELNCTFLFRVFEIVLPSSHADCSPKVSTLSSKLHLLSPHTGNMYSFRMRVNKGKGMINNVRLVLAVNPAETSSNMKSETPVYFTTGSITSGDNHFYKNKSINLTGNTTIALKDASSESSTEAACKILCVRKNMTLLFQ